MNTPLKREREHRLKSQLEVATAIGIERSHYSRIESGQARASAETAKKIFGYFGAPLTLLQILYPEDSEPTQKKPTRSARTLQEASA